jgi:hypothetical protein
VLTPTSESLPRGSGKAKRKFENALRVASIDFSAPPFPRSDQRIAPGLLHAVAVGSDPHQNRDLQGLELLKKADLVILSMRWRDLPDEQMKMLIDYIQSGRPILAIRTGTHPFALKTSTTYEQWSWNSTVPGWEGGFGRKVLGET